MLTLSARLTLN